MKSVRYVIFSSVFLFITIVGISAVELPEYVGVAKCRTCHMSSSRGNQYIIWKESAHSHAYATLATEKAREAAEKMGVTEDPQKSEKCLKCHTTAFNVADSLIESSFDFTLGVQCEACHGSGSLYRKPTIMSAKKYRDDPAGTLELWKELGLVIPGEKQCRGCHTNEDFDFNEKFKLIAHPNPNISQKS